ncbi:hypothetical protein Sjap_011478 [Stephania japonica]|uniref:DUF1677 family protein n=1 Tax=Stephania japonica TaxID=461633 RepID=A0AAP0P847_9MAGN
MSTTLLAEIRVPYLRATISNKNDQGLRRAQSDATTIGDILDRKLIYAKTIERVECRCCGHTEDCTPDYINDVKDSHCGNWVCGLCSEAVKDKLLRSPAGSVTLEEVVNSHTDFCQTTRLNPKLSLAWAMKDIAQRSSQQRASLMVKSSSIVPKIARTSSCFPCIHQE